MELKRFMTLNQKEYDFIFSLGEACSSTEALRKSDLQVVSNPLDWVVGPTFEERINFLLNDFENFLNIEDLMPLNCTNDAEINLCDVYLNKRNNITFNHEFPVGCDYKTHFNKIKEKYNRRIKRLYEKINNAEKVLVVYIETPNNKNKLDDNNRLIDGLNKIKTKFPNKQIDLLYFINDTSYKIMEYKTDIITNEITKITGNYNRLDENLPPHVVNFEYFKEIFKQYKLKLPISFYIKNIIIRYLILLIPSHTTRRKIRRKYHV